MSRPKNPLPTYRQHKNEARCWVGGRWVTLGPWNSPESRAEFARICTEIAASSSAAATARSTPAGATVSEMILAFWKHVEQHYRRPDGTPTGEVSEYKSALRILRQLYGHTPAREFGPLALKAVRDAMVKAGWCRTRTNNQTRRVRRAFKWAASEEIVPGSLVADLACVTGLRAGRTTAREMEPVKPAPEADYRATLPQLVPTVRAMAEVQRLGGLRPCEVRLLVPADLDRTGDLWVYRPDQHKMSYLGIKKAIPLPPAARAVLEPWLAGRGPNEYLFTPARARAEMYELRRARRKSKVQPSQLDRTKPEAAKTRPTRDVFTTQNYGKWIARACVRAGVEPWSPGQLRHSFGTEVRDRFGLEIAQVLLGHKNAKTTEIYAEAALEKGKAAAKQMG